MYWLRRRLGCAGRPCLRIRERIRECLPEIRQEEDRPLGFSSSELADFSETHQLAEIAKRFAWRGNIKNLERIAWWGSALGDVASVRRPIDRSRVLWEAASFNLGVSLFDSILENESDKFPPLARALDGVRLRARLVRPSITHRPLTCDDNSLDLIVRLFDTALAGAGRRFNCWPAQIEYLSELLEVMYRSELGLSEDRFAAKTMPVVFIGALGNDYEDEQAHWFFGAFGRFIQLWDDWLDLSEDLRSLAPNAFLGAPRSVISFDALGYSIRFLARTVGGRLFHEGIALTLSDALRISLSAARHWDIQGYRKTLLLCHKLVQ